MIQAKQMTFGAFNVAEGTLITHPFPILFDVFLVKKRAIVVSAMKRLWLRQWFVLIEADNGSQQ